MVTMATTKNMGIAFQMFQTIQPLNFMFVLSLETEICYTVYCLTVNLAFQTSHNLLFFSFYKTSETHFRFSVVFSQKTVQIMIFNIEKLSGSADFKDFVLILQDFGWPFR